MSKLAVASVAVQADAAVSSDVAVVPIAAVEVVAAVGVSGVAHEVAEGGFVVWIVPLLQFRFPVCPEKFRN